MKMRIGQYIDTNRKHKIFHPLTSFIPKFSNEVTFYFIFLQHSNEVTSFKVLVGVFQKIKKSKSKYNNKFKSHAHVADLKRRHQHQHSLHSPTGP